jgi:hypothetical protein
MKFKKIFILLLSICVICSGCGNKVDEVNVKTNEMLAGGTIPANAKIFPVTKEDVSMTLDDKKNYLSESDIWTLTHYVDVWESMHDTRGDGFQKDEAAEFLNSTRLAQIEEILADSNFDYKVDGVQILTMTVQDDEEVEVTYVVTLTGFSPTANEEGTYEAIHALRFQKVNGNWYEDGVSFMLMARAGTINYIKDDITGEYTVETLAEYWK